MIDTRQLRQDWGYAPSRATFGNVTPGQPTGPTGGNTSITKPPGSYPAAAGTPTITAQQPVAPQTYTPNVNDPYGGAFWTPEEWGDVSDFARAGMRTPFQQSEGVTKGIAGVDQLMSSGGWGTGIDEYRAATDPLFALQQKRIADQVKQAALMGGFNDSTMLTDRLSQRLGENMMGREADFAERALSLEEARKNRMMGGLGLYGQFGQQQAGEREGWANRGMRYAGLGLEAGDRYFRAPFDFASGTGEQAGGWLGSMVTPEEQMYNDYFNVDNETQKYTPGIAPQLGGFFGDVGETYGSDIWGWLKGGG